MTDAKFDDIKVKTTRLRNMLKTVCENIFKYYKFIDGLKVSKVILSSSTMQDYWGAITVCSSNCHSKHRRYLELLETLGKIDQTFHFVNLSELQIQLALRGL